MNFHVVIPARFASVRLPGKPLRKIGGRTLIEHVYNRALASGARHVIVATDDSRIENECRAFGAEVCMTAMHHQSGTDRVAEVVQINGWSDDTIVVNLQGDEPLMPASDIHQVAALLQADMEADIATLSVPIRGLDELMDPNVVKVVLDEAGRALYFSRAPIPWNRDGAAGGVSTQTQYEGALRHVGLYAYRAGSVCELAGAPAGLLELTERLEQLRALQLGMKIRVDLAEETPGPGVDTEEDLLRVESVLEGDGFSG